MHKKIILALYVLSGFCLKAQVNLDSLYTVWQDQTQADSNRTNAYENYIWEGFLFSNPDTAFVLAQSLLRFGEEEEYEKAKSLAYNLMGTSNLLKADYPKALDYYQRSLKIYEEMGNKEGRAKTIANIGLIYKNQGDFSKALDYYQRSLKIQEEIGDTKGIAATIGNIGNIYQEQGDYPLALDYFQRCLKIVEEIGDKQVSANTIGNIGTNYKFQGDYPKALEYFQRSLMIYEEMGNKEGCARTIANIGLIYKNQGDYPKALEYSRRSLKSFEEMGIQEGIAWTINTIGLIYKNQGDYTKALNNCQTAYELSLSKGFLRIQKDCCTCLYDTYKAMGNSNKALKYLELLTSIEKSLNEEETSKKLQRMEFQKQMFADSLARNEEILLTQQIEEELIQSKNRKNLIQYSLVVMVVLFLAALIAAMTKFNFKPKVASSLIFIFFILIFEFLLVVLDPWVNIITDGEVGFKIGINSIMALIIFGIHQISEKRLKKALIKVVDENQ